MFFSIEEKHYVLTCKDIGNTGHDKHVAEQYLKYNSINLYKYIEAA